MSRASYFQRMNRVCDYIEQHLDDDLSLAVLCEVAHFSKFHFHRQFSQAMGINVFRFIQLMRMKRASYQLAFYPQFRVLDVALQAGFESSEAFSRAFKKTFGQTPSQFRKQPNWVSWHQQYPETSRKGNQTMQTKTVEIIDFPKTLIAVKEHRASHEQLNESIASFIEWRKQTSHSPVDTSDSFGILYDDPAAVAPEDFRFDICGSVKVPIPDNPQGVMNKELPPGRCAHLVHYGSHDAMDTSVYFLYRDWLPESGESLRDFPCFVRYRNLFPEVDEHELVTDIYLPLQ